MMRAFALIAAACCLLLPGSAAADLYVGKTSGATSNEIFRYSETISQSFVSRFGAGQLTPGVPEGLAFGADTNLYVANAFGVNRVVRYSASGSPLGIFVSEGQGGLFTPMGLTFGPDSHLYVVSANSGHVKRYNGVTGANLPSGANPGATFSTIAASGLTGIAFGPDGFLYVKKSDGVVRVDPVTGSANTSFITEGGLNGGADLAWGPDGRLYVYYSTTIRRYNADGTGGANFITGLSNPGNAGLAFRSDGFLFVSDGNVTGGGISGGVRLFDASGVNVNGAGGRWTPTAGNAEQYFGTGYLAISAVPEPGTVALLAGAAGLLYWRRRRKLQDAALREAEETAAD